VSRSDSRLRQIGIEKHGGDLPMPFPEWYGRQTEHVLTPLLVQDNRQKGLVDFDFAVVLDEA
jgi:hypothetical protein